MTAAEPQALSERVEGALAARCPCGHPAWTHRTTEAENLDRETGHRHTSMCAGSVIGPVCVCQVDQATAAAPVPSLIGGADGGEGE